MAGFALSTEDLNKATHRFVQQGQGALTSASAVQ
jgi:hypothetical protein